MPGGRSDEPLDIGAVEIEAYKVLEVGDTAPLFETQTLDGKPLKLADFKGKYVLLDFWATGCGPCLGQIPYLKAVYEAFGKDERFVIISLSLDEDAETAKKFVQENEVKWVQGFLGDWEKTPVPTQYGVVGIPAIFLIGPDGKIIARVRGERIKPAVAEAPSAK